MPLRRRAITVGLLLLGAGATSSVLTAWAAVWWSDLSGAPTTTCFLHAPPGVNSGVQEIEFRRTTALAVCDYTVVYWSRRRGGPEYGVKPSAFDTWPWPREVVAPELAPGAAWPRQGASSGVYGWKMHAGQAAGWPMLCLLWMSNVQPDGSKSATGMLEVTGAQPRSPYFFSSLVVLPISPVWSGLLVCTLVHGGLWGLAGVVVMRAWQAFRRRLTAGRCPKCRYPLEGLPPGAPCPECGTMVSTSSESEPRSSVP